MAGDMLRAVIELGDVLDAHQAARLLDELKLHRGRDLEIRAGSVARCSTLGLQVLMSAAATWTADDRPLRIVGASAPLLEAARTLGLSAGQLPVEAVTPCP